MKEKARKQDDVKQLQAVLAESPTVFVCAFEGLKVQEDFELRKQVRAQGASYRVIQNRLAHLASQGSPYEKALTGLRGMTSIAYGGDDPLALIKALVAYGKDHPVFEFKSGVVEGKVLDPDGLNALSKLPSKQDLQAKILFLIQSPAQQLLSVLNGPGRDLAVVVKQAIEEKKFAAE